MFFDLKYTHILHSMNLVTLHNILLLQENKKSLTLAQSVFGVRNIMDSEPII